MVNHVFMLLIMVNHEPPHIFAALASISSRSPSAKDVSPYSFGQAPWSGKNMKKARFGQARLAKGKTKMNSQREYIIVNIPYDSEYYSESMIHSEYYSESLSQNIINSDYCIIFIVIFNDCHRIS